MALMGNATELLKQGRATEAVLQSVDGICELFQRIQARGARRP